MVFGGTEEKQIALRKNKAIEKLERESPAESLARRAAFNVTASGERNMPGSNELVEAVSKGEVDLAGMDEDLLPAALQSMAPAERKKMVADTAPAAICARKLISCRKTATVISRRKSRKQVVLLIHWMTSSIAQCSPRQPV
jgi:hypothetical protein